MLVDERGICTRLDSGLVTKQCALADSVAVAALKAMVHDDETLWVGMGFGFSFGSPFAGCMWKKTLRRIN